MFGFKKKKHILQSGEIKAKEFLQKISFDFVANLPIIKVEIEKRSYRFLFDTGALSVVPSHLVHELSLEVIQEIAINDSQEKLSSAFLYRLPSLKIGELEFCDFVVVASDFSQDFPLSCIGFDGIIGYNFLSSLVLGMSYERREIVLSSQPLSLSGYTKTPLIFDGKSGPMFEINFPFRNVLFGIDSGKNDGISLAVTQEHGAFKEYALETREIVGLLKSSFSGTKEYSKETLYLIENFNITKNISIKKYPISLNDGAVSLVGNSFLKHFDMIVDFKKEMLYLRALSEQPIEQAFRRSFGFFLHWDEKQKLYISALSQNSAASNAGLALGDRVLALGEKDTYEFTKEEYCQLYLALNSDDQRSYESLETLELTLKRGTQIKRVILKQNGK